MSDDAATYTIELIDRITGPASGATGALDKLSSHLGATASAASRMDGAWADANGRLHDANGRFLAMGSSANGASGALGNLGGASEGAAGSLGAVSAAGTALVGVLVVVAAATGAVIVQMAELSFKATELREAQLGLALAETDSIEQANALVDAQYAVARSSSLTQQAVFDLSNALLRAGVPADQFNDTLRAMADVSAVAGDRAVKSLQKIIANSEQLGHFQLKDTALKNSGIKMQEVLANLSKNLGISVDKVKIEMKAGHIAVEDGLRAMNQALETKFAGPASRKMLDFGVQMTKLHENFLSLFDGVDASPFLGALHNVLTLFDQTNEHGKGLKTGITSVMNTIFRVGAEVVYGLEGIFLGLEIGLLKVYIAAHPLINQLKKALGLDGTGTSDGFKKLSKAAEIVAIVVGMSVAMVIELIIVVAKLSTWTDQAYESTSKWSQIPSIVAGVVASFISAASHVKFFGTSISEIYTKVKSVVSRVIAAISSAFGQAVSLGADLINGLIAGIEAGAGAVADAVKSVASGAIDAGKAVLHINSPSKVFQAQGHSIGEGMTLGINDSRGAVETSMRALAVVPSLPANDNARPSLRQAPKVRESGGSRGNSITMYAGAITIHVRSSDPKAAAMEIRAELQKILEEAAAVGGGENEEAA